MMEFVVFRTPTRAEMPLGPTEDESRLISAHFDYLEQAHSEGKVLIAGRTVEEPFVGVSVIRAENKEAAEAFLAADPGVRGGIFQVRLQPYRVALLGSLNAD